PALDEGARRAAADVETRLDNARSAHSFAGGLDEVWAAVRAGRAGLIVVEEHFQAAVQVTDEHLEPAPEGSTQ
ncbi:chemotaxis protein, partial [Streptomyces sp. SID7499]|nr:chemotaxis protein [Streptomyces sp. SID7499]